MQRRRESKRQKEYYKKIKEEKPDAIKTKRSKWMARYHNDPEFRAKCIAAVIERRKNKSQGEIMKKEISKYLSEIGKKGGAKTSESKKKSSAENGKLGGAPKKTYYLLSGEGEDGIWSGPFETTGRGVRMRAKREECGGDRWCRIFELYPETETRIACVIDIDNDDTRDVPDIDED